MNRRSAPRRVDVFCCEGGFVDEKSSHFQLFTGFANSS